MVLYLKGILLLIIHSGFLLHMERGLPFAHFHLLIVYLTLLNEQYYVNFSALQQHDLRRRRLAHFEAAARGCGIEVIEAVVCWLGAVSRRPRALGIASTGAAGGRTACARVRHAHGLRLRLADAVTGRITARARTRFDNTADGSRAVDALDAGALDVGAVDGSRVVESPSKQ